MIPVQINLFSIDELDMNESSIAIDEHREF